MRRGNEELTFFNVLFTEVSSEVSWTDTDNGLCTAHTSILTGTCWKRKRGRGREREGKREMKGLASIKLMSHFSANKQCNVSKPDTIGTE